MANEQFHTKHPHGPTTANFRSLIKLHSPYFNGHKRPNTSAFGWKFLCLCYCRCLHTFSEKDAKIEFTVLFDHWIVRFGIPDVLVADNGNEYINGEFAHFCRMYNVNFRPRTT